MRKRSKTPSAKPQNPVEQAFDLPEMLHAGVPRLELQGNRELALDGCRGLLEYTETRIRLHAGALLLTVEGAALCIRTYSDSQTVITGDIRALAFESVTA